MKLAVVANAKKLGAKQGTALKAAARPAGHDPDWYVVKKGSACKEGAEKALANGADVVVVCGGDGSVRAAAEALVGTHTALAVLPCGTANLFATAMDLPSDPEAVIAAIQGGVRRTIDTGVCNDRTFNVMAGTGFDAGMIDAADDAKDRLGTFAYLKAGARQARERAAFEVEVEVDGQHVFEGPATCVLVGNLGTLKGGVSAFPDASPTDGRLDLAVVTAAGMREWASLMLSAVRNRQQLTGHADLWCGEEFTVRLDGKHRFELDGGVKGKAKELRFGIRPASLTVCVGS